MNEKPNIKRVYHPYTLWEDYKHGFYDNCTGSDKDAMLLKSIEMFNDEILTKKYMNKVIETWKYSCEQNLTNPSMNKIAYIGQGACCLYARVPSTVTMEAWSHLTDEVKERSNNIAKNVIDNWNNNNKKIQLCLNII
jgi:hypothetical protein